jgi:hypothetical protein
LSGLLVYKRTMSSALETQVEAFLNLLKQSPEKGSLTRKLYSSMSREDIAEHEAILKEAKKSAPKPSRAKREMTPEQRAKNLENLEKARIRKAEMKAAQAAAAISPEAKVSAVQADIKKTEAPLTESNEVIGVAASSTKTAGQANSSDGTAINATPTAPVKRRIYARKKQTGIVGVPEGSVSSTL